MTASNISHTWHIWRMDFDKITKDYTLSVFSYEHVTQTRKLVATIKMTHKQTDGLYEMINQVANHRADIHRTGFEESREVW